MDRFKTIVSEIYENSKAKYIDPITGTVGDIQTDSIHGGGKTHPGACTPGGMVQLSPDTVTGGDNGTGYNYCHDTIEGFSFNHMSGIGWYGDLGNLQVMPVIGDTDLRSGSNEEIPFTKGTEGWKSKFAHDNEVAKAGYYSVFLERYGITAEATACEHAGLLRFTYPKDGEAGIIFNFSRRIAGNADYQEIKLIGNDCIEGHIICTPDGGGFGRGYGKVSYDFYFVCKLSESAKEMRFFSNEEYADEKLTEFSGKDVGLKVTFENPMSNSLVLKCGISYTDLDGARNNLNSECTDFDFDKKTVEAFSSWDKACDIVKIESNDETELKKFYTCLYHALLDPRTATDADGRFTIDGKTFSSEDYKQRTMFSGWDVYRSEFPLLTVIRPDMIHDEINSLIKIADIKNSSFPRWELMGNDSRCMVGDPGLLIIADAYLKGIDTFDVEKAYQIALASSKGKKELNGREFKSLYPDSKQYAEQAYVPGSLSETLEFLAADYAMSRFAKKAGHSEDAKYYMSRVKKYSENYNESLGFMAPRDEEGNFLPIADEYIEKGCVESNIFQQSWYAPYDIEGLCDLFGRERAVELLERLFEKADFSAMWNVNYNHSNEPCHNVTHYFNLLGLAHRTQYWTRRIQKEAYRLGAFGFCGNEDVGQLSAWYVLSAFGFAQICQGCDLYFVNTPLFKKAEIKLNPQYHSCVASDTLTVVCDKDPDKYPYIQSLTLNGTPIERTYLSYAEITSGGKLEFTLSEEPNTEFGKDVHLNLTEL